MPGLLRVITLPLPSVATPTPPVPVPTVKNAPTRLPAVCWPLKLSTPASPVSTPTPPARPTDMPIALTCPCCRTVSWPVLDGPMPTPMKVSVPVRRISDPLPLTVAMPLPPGVLSPLPPM